MSWEMDEKEMVHGSSYASTVVSEERSASFYSMYFGVSCAFFALRVCARADKKDENLSELFDRMLQGSAHLLGLLVWRIQRGEVELLRKLEASEKEIRELKRIRREDAKANEKVVGIFASQEQSWLTEKRKLRQHIGALLNELRALERNKNEEVVSESNDRLMEMELLLTSKGRELEEEQVKRREVEEKLAEAEKFAEELRQTAKREAQEHSTDLWKHKTAFLELVSNQRHLEAEMARAYRQLEAKRQELDAVLEQKEESMLLAQKLSMEVMKLRKDLEQKEKILSAMLRKSKLDTTEKQMLLKEVKSSKAKRKQAELETEEWRVVTESRHERHSLRSMFSRSDDPSVARIGSQIGKGRSQLADYVLEYDSPEFRKASQVFTPFSDHYSPEENNEPGITADFKQLEGWVRSEAEKYATAIEKRHHLEIDAFAEQMRMKDEKLEAFRWKMLSMEIESKRLQTHIEGINQDVLQLRHENKKLEALLLERQEEVNALKQQLSAKISPQICHRTNLNSSLHDLALSNDSIWSKVEIIKRKSTEKDPDTRAAFMETNKERDTEKEKEAADQESKSIVLVQSPEREFEEDVKEESLGPMESDGVESLPMASPSESLIRANNSTCKMDLHALGVSYKIKRLKQQLITLERISGKIENEDDEENGGKEQNGTKDITLLISLLNKQVSRYQSLQGKTDELCKRMQDNDVYTNKIRCMNSSIARSKGETKPLEQFLQETFQLQRYMVSTGQKLMEVQAKIGSGLVMKVPQELDKFGTFDMKQFADNMRILFREIQRGLEVRIARIIGDLEGTLACEGMIRMRR